MIPTFVLPRGHHSLPRYDLLCLNDKTGQTRVVVGEPGCTPTPFVPDPDWTVVAVVMVGPT